MLLSGVNPARSTMLRAQFNGQPYTVMIRPAARVLSSTVCTSVASPARQKMQALPGPTCLTTSRPTSPVSVPTLDRQPKQTNSAFSGN